MKKPRMEEKLIFRGFHLISDDEGKHVEVRLRVKRRPRDMLFSTETVKSIWKQEGVFHVTIAGKNYWLELAKDERTKEMHEKAIPKIKRFLEGEIPAEHIWMMNGTIKEINENERFYYVGYVE